MADDEQKVDLSLDSYIKLLTDYRSKAEKVFGMGVPNPNVNYVVSALDYAIKVAQGKGQISTEEKQAVLRSAEELTKSAMQFHSKFAKLRDSINQQEEAADAENEAPNRENEGGLGMK